MKQADTDIIQLLREIKAATGPGGGGATIAATTNLLIGDGAGNGSSSGIGTGGTVPNSKFVFSPTAAFEFLRVNVPTAWTGSIPFTLAMENVANSDASYNTPVQMGFNPHGSVDATKWGNYLSIEPHYRPESDNFAEFHYEVRSPAGVMSRLFSSTFIQGATMAASTNTWDFRGNSWNLFPVTGATPYFSILANQIAFDSSDATEGWSLVTSTASSPGLVSLSPTHAGEHNFNLPGWAQVVVDGNVTAGARFRTTGNAVNYSGSGAGMELGFDAVTPEAIITVYDRTAGAYRQLRVAAANITFNTGDNTPAMTLANDQSAAFAASVTAAAGFKPPSLTDGAAENNTIYYSTTASKLVYKDAGGTVNALY